MSAAAGADEGRRPAVPRAAPGVSRRPASHVARPFEFGDDTVVVTSAARGEDVAYAAYKVGYYCKKTISAPPSAFHVAVDHKTFQALFGSTLGKSDKAPRLAESDFESRVALAAVKSDRRLWEPEVEEVTRAGKVLGLHDRAKAPANKASPKSISHLLVWVPRCGRPRRPRRTPPSQCRPAPAGK